MHHMGGGGEAQHAQQRGKVTPKRGEVHVGAGRGNHPQPHSDEVPIELNVGVTSPQSSPSGDSPLPVSKPGTGGFPLPHPHSR